MIDSAVVVCPGTDAPEASLLKLHVAGLPLLLRILLTARQAGIERFLVVASAPQQRWLRPQLDAEAQLEGRIRWLEPTEAFAAPADSLLLLPSVLLDSTALRSWLARVAPNGSLASPEPGIGPTAVPAAHLPACLEAALGGESGLERYLRQVQRDCGLRHVPWEGASWQPIRSPQEVPGIERRMIEAFRSAEDGPIVDRCVNRPLAAYLSRRLVASRVTPNQITLASLLTGLLGAWTLHFDGFPTSLVGLLLFQLSVVLDHVDGEVARLKFQFSRLGKWLDNVSDQAVGLAVIGCLTWRVAVNGTIKHLAVLGLAAALGVTGAFLIVFWWSLSGQRLEARLTTTAKLVARSLSTLANRDGFSLALWATLPLDRPTWFLWALALGANAYWLAWLLVYGLPSPASRR
ncbi:MAG TPA: CDP-alcohol phosphatidyltransferase family protein [Candidatus Methylomirabilis sp.]|nr:CDP-alcohol phosphatidyltransferase family protein [Candidatus Methylomirabilis sp.]